MHKLIVIFLLSVQAYAMDNPVINILYNLVRNSDELKLSLAKDPDLIKKQDSDGLTLLHHAAQIGSFCGSSSSEEILNILFNAPGVDFTIKDNNNNTPVHVAALCCEDRTTCKFIFPEFLKAAERHKFNFSTLGQNGRSVLHIATTCSYTDHGFSRRENNVLNVINNVKNPGLNVFSESGATAFFYAVNSCHFPEALALLDAGAKPKLYGSEERKPKTVLKRYISKLDKELKTETDPDRRAALLAKRKDLKIFKKKCF
jgi:ankyrin repeat protein